MKSHKYKTDRYDNFTQGDYDLLYETIKDSYKVIRNYLGYKDSIKYRVILRSQVILSERHYKYVSPPRNEKAYRALKDARRAMNNPAFNKLNGVRIVNDIFDIIDNISGTQPADVESGMLELKDTVRSMNRLNEEAKAVSGKCEVIADNLTNICKYMDGEVETININIGCKHTPTISNP